MFKAIVEFRLIATIRRCVNEYDKVSVAMLRFYLLPVAREAISSNSNASFSSYISFMTLGVDL